MSCQKKCKCIEEDGTRCEMLMDKQTIIIDDDEVPYESLHLFVNCFKCTHTGNYDFDTISLKIGGFDKDVLPISEYPIARDILNLHRKIQGE